MSFGNCKFFSGDIEVIFSGGTANCATLNLFHPTHNRSISEIPQEDILQKGQFTTVRELPPKSEFVFELRRSSSSRPIEVCVKFNDYKWIRFFKSLAASVEQTGSKIEDLELIQVKDVHFHESLYSSTYLFDLVGSQKSPQVLLLSHTRLYACFFLDIKEIAESTAEKPSFSIRASFCFSDGTTNGVAYLESEDLDLLRRVLALPKDIWPDLCRSFEQEKGFSWQKFNPLGTDSNRQQLAVDQHKLTCFFSCWFRCAPFYRARPFQFAYIHSGSEVPWRLKRTELDYLSSVRVQDRLTEPVSISVSHLNLSLLNAF